MTATTPVFQLEYIVEGEPLRNARPALENNAKTIEAALLRGPASPPNAQDLATVAGRVTSLESRVTVLEQAVVVTGSTLVTPTANVPTAKRVDFPAGTFAGTPVVMVTAISGSIGDHLKGASANNISATGFDVVVFRDNTTNTNVAWVAFGVKP